MIRIAHLSDSHFGTVSDQKQDALEEALKALKPDLILLSGDITQRARKREFKAARNFLDRFRGTPVVSTMGNHDISLTNPFERLFFPSRRYSSILKHPPEGRWIKDGVEVVCLNSTSRFRHKDGALTSFELMRLDTQSADVNFRVAVFHHPMDCAKASDQKNVIAGSESISEKLQTTDVDLVVGGHVHDPFVTLSNSRYSGRPYVISVAGTCLSSRTRSGAPNSFSVYSIENEKLTVDRFDLNIALNFQLVQSRKFTRGHDRAWAETTS